MRAPKLPNSNEDVRLVFEVLSLSCSVEMILLTCSVFFIVATWAEVSRLPPPSKPFIPAGLIVTFVPAFALISVIFVSILDLATSMHKIRPILIESISIIAPDLNGLRNAFLMPRVTTFIVSPCY